MLLRITGLGKEGTCITLTTLTAIFFIFLKL